MKKAVIFDMDGVLIDSEKVYMKWTEEFLQRNKIKMTEDIKRKLIGSSQLLTGQIISDVWPYPISAEDALELIRENQKRYTIDYQKILDPEAKTLLHNLKQKGLVLSLASSSPKRTIRKVMLCTGLEQYFDYIVSGEEVERYKPNPEIYLAVLRHLDCSAKESIVVEDSEYGIEAAKKAGIDVIAKREKMLPVNQDNADYIVDSLKEIELCIDVLNQRERNEDSKSYK